jgi:hypothetical protein
VSFGNLETKEFQVNGLNDAKPATAAAAAGPAPFKIPRLEAEDLQGAKQNLRKMSVVAYPEAEGRDFDAGKFHERQEKRAAREARDKHRQERRDRRESER